jgi:putative addiction module component (TIGR02574 family)
LRPIESNSGIRAAPSGGVVAEMRALRGRIKPDPESWTTDDYVPCSRLALPPGPLFRRLGSMESLTPDEIVRLTPPERLALIAQLWDSLEHEQLPLTSAQEAELERRLSSFDEDRREGVTWASLKAELEQRCP